MSEWISVDDSLPPYGAEVFISINGVKQDITYMRDGADDCEDWFEPFERCATDGNFILCRSADKWTLLNQ